jgi:hypothetical protein
MMNWNGFVRNGRNQILGQYLGILLEGQRKTTKSLGQYNCYPGRELNQTLPEYEAGVLTT